MVMMSKWIFTTMLVSVYFFNTGCCRAPPPPSAAARPRQAAPTRQHKVSSAKGGAPTPNSARGVCGKEPSRGRAWSVPVMVGITSKWKSQLERFGLRVSTYSAAAARTMYYQVYYYTIVPNHIGGVDTPGTPLPKCRVPVLRSYRTSRSLGYRIRVHTQPYRRVR